MLRIVTMGILVPAVALISAAVSVGSLSLPVITMPQPATLLLAAATGLAGLAAMSYRRK